MLEPVSILVALSGFLGGWASKAYEKLGEKALEKGSDWLQGEILVRTAGEFGLVTNHDAERAVRRAQIAALTALLRAYERDLPREDEAEQFPGLFAEAAEVFVNRARARCEEADLTARADEIGKAITALDGALVPVRTT